MPALKLGLRIYDGSMALWNYVQFFFEIGGARISE